MAGLSPQELICTEDLTDGCASYYTPQTGSTNDLALSAWQAGFKTPAVFCTDEQTAGRGRFDRVWEGKKGSALMFSFLFVPECPPQRFPILTEVFALAVCDALEKTGFTGVQLKWPNDIILSERKVCGILTQATPDGKATVIGAGINLFKDAYPPELAETAISLEEAGEKTGPAVPSPRDLQRDIIHAFFNRYKTFLKTSDMSLLKKDYCARLINTGRRVRMMERQKEITGTAAGIDDEGRLLFQKDEGETLHVGSGEVSVKWNRTGGTDPLC